MIYLLLWLLVGTLFMNGIFTWRFYTEVNGEKDNFLFVTLMILLGPLAPILMFIVLGKG